MTADAGRWRHVEDLLSRAISRLVMLDEERAGRIARLQGSVIELCVRDTEWRAYAMPRTHGIELRRYYDGHVDVRVTGRPGDFFAYARASRRGDSFGAGRIEISGDLATAQNVQALLADLEIDWEDAISPLVGEIGAHQVTRLVRQAKNFFSSAAAHFETDLADYLRYEARMTPTRDDIEKQHSEICAVAGDVDRLEARLAVLRRAGSRN